METFITSFIIPVAYLALFLGAVGIIVFAIIQMLKDLKKAQSALIGVGALFVVFLLCYILADGQATKDHTVNQMKLINAGIYSVYLVLAGSVAAVIYAAVIRYFKN
ncbi:MAG: hypothetical protein LBS03_07120 [Bacteroidales bacterium]|jgi:hypothetical protein|nr:hypothetical protein [Bacteroidales bacterium]